MPRIRGDEEYQRRLGEVLRTGSLPALRAFLEEQAARFGDARQVAEVRDQPDDALAQIMHRMILARNDLADLHPASRRWLFEHGQDSYGRGGARRN